MLIKKILLVSFYLSIYSCTNSHYFNENNAINSNIDINENNFDNKIWEYKDYFEKLNDKSQISSNIETYTGAKVSPDGKNVLVLKIKTSEITKEVIPRKILQNKQFTQGVINLQSKKFTANTSEEIVKDSEFRIRPEFRLNDYFWIDNSNYVAIYATYTFSPFFEVDYLIKKININNNFSSVIHVGKSKRFLYSLKFNWLYLFNENQLMRFNLKDSTAQIIVDYKNTILKNVVPKKIYHISDSGNLVAFGVSNDHSDNIIDIYTLDFDKKQILKTIFNKNYSNLRNDNFFKFSISPNEKKYIIFYNTRIDGLLNQRENELLIEIHNFDEKLNREVISEKYKYDNNKHQYTLYLPDEIIWIDENRLLGLSNEFENLYEYLLDINTIKRDLSYIKSKIIGFNENKDLYYFKKSENNINLLIRKKNENISLMSWDRGIFSEENISRSDNYIWFEIIDNERYLISYILDLKNVKLTEVFKRKAQFEDINLTENNNINLTENNNINWKFIDIIRNDPILNYKYKEFY